MQCQDQKSQHKNKEKAFKVLRSRLYDMELAKKQEEASTPVAGHVQADQAYC